MPRVRVPIVTVRMVVASLALGLGLAAASVPAGTLVEAVGQRGYRAGELPGRLRTQEVSVLRRAERGGDVSSLYWTDWGGGCLPIFMPIEPGTLPPIAEKAALRTGHTMRVAWAGFPLGAAVGWTDVETDTTHGLARWTPADPSQEPLDFPWRPLWFGLLGNTLIYAVLPLACAITLGALRTRRWKKHGRCEACGYELGAGISVCPECGLAARS